MAINYFQIIMLVPTTISSILWIFLRMRSRNQYVEIMNSISPDDYRFSDLFPIGFAFMDLIHFNMRSPRARKRIKEISEIYGRKFAEYYFYIQQGSMFAYSLSIVLIVCFITVLANDYAVLVFGAIIGGLLIWYMQELINDKLEARRTELLLDFPQVLSKLTLLVNTGMVLREAWKKVSFTGERVLYREMQTTTNEMNNGVTELEAYRNFAERCALKEIKKFTNTITQNLQKGNEELVLFLNDMAEEMWEGKKNKVMQKAEAASSKLLIPTTMIFLGILLLIMVPMFSSI